MDAELRVLAHEARGGGLPARVGINLRVEHEHLDVHAAGQHAAQALETDVEHRAVAADDPELFVVPAHLIPARADAHGVGGRVLEKRIRPRYEIRIVGIRRGINRRATGRVDDADVFLAINKTCRREHHAQRCAFAASHARSRAADIQQRTLGQHHVREQLLVDELLGRLGHLRVEVPRALIAFQRAVIFLQHRERAVITAGVHALGAALALGRVNEDAEVTRLVALLFIDVPELGRLAKLLAIMLALGFVGNLGEFRFELRLGDDLAEDGGVRALDDARHAGDAILAVEQRNLRRDVGKIAQDARAGGDERAQRAEVGGQFQFGAAVVVRADDAAVEIRDVQDVVGNGYLVDAVGRGDGGG